MNHAAQVGRSLPRRPWRLSDFLRRAVVERPLAAFLAIMFIAAVVSAVVLFQQTLTAPSPVGAVVTEGDCDPVPPTPPTYIVGTSGFVTWSCTTSSAIHVNAAGSATPTITKGTEWTTTYIYKTSGTAPTTNCASATITKALTSGTAVSFVVGDIGDWNYCSDYVNAPNPMSSVVYSWSQP
jgi:hypothetical protein